MSDPSQFSRRQMLLGSAVVGATAAAAGGAVVDRGPSEAPRNDDHRTVVLKDTSHIRAYYALARS